MAGVNDDRSGARERDAPAGAPPDADAGATIAVGDAAFAADHAQAEPVILPPTLIFDVETVPDVAGARRLYPLDGLSDAEVVEFLEAQARIRSGRAFQPHLLQRVVAIGVVYTAGERLHVEAIGRETADADPDAHEHHVLSRFFDAIERRSPTLVSWNGTGFDAPVLHHRALLRGVTAARYWEQGDRDRAFRFNHYLGRFHQRHTDLMDVLAGYQGRAVARLDAVATLLGLPGKLGMDGSQVARAWMGGQRRAVFDYVEHDVLNTYLVYLRYLVMRGDLSDAQYQRRARQLAAWLDASEADHHQAFVRAWRAVPAGLGTVGALRVAAAGGPVQETSATPNDASVAERPAGVGAAHGVDRCAGDVA